MYTGSTVRIHKWAAARSLTKWSSSLGQNGPMSVIMQSTDPTDWNVIMCHYTSLHAVSFIFLRSVTKRTQCHKTLITSLLHTKFILRRNVLYNVESELSNNKNYFEDYKLCFLAFSICASPFYYILTGTEETKCLIGHIIR